MKRSSTEPVSDFFAAIFAAIWCIFIVAMMTAPLLWVTIHVYSWVWDC